MGRTPFHAPRHRTRTPCHQALGRQLPLRPCHRNQRTLPPRPGQVHPLPPRPLLQIPPRLQRPCPSPRPGRLHPRLHHPHRHLVHPPHPRHQRTTRHHP